VHLRLDVVVHGRDVRERCQHVQGAECAGSCLDARRFAGDPRAQPVEDFQLALKEWLREHPIPTGDVHNVVDHIEHIIQVAGVDHVGLGSDFDGINAVPRQLEDVSCYPNITQELLNRGHGRQEVLKILGANLLRVLRAAAETAKNSSAVSHYIRH